MELSTPLTVYWDLPPEPADPGTLERICAGIIACRPLMLQLRDPGPGIGPATWRLLQQLQGAPLALFVTVCRAAPDSLAQLGRQQGVKEILLALERAEEFASLGEAVGRDRGGAGAPHPELGISFAVTRDNWRQLPELVRYCRFKGLARLVLPMQRLYLAEPPFGLDLEEQRQLAQALVAAGGVQGFKLTIHDPFLWRAFYPGAPFPQGGCQAANTMLAIAPDGLVYPCPTLPLPLGDAGQTPLREIAASAGKKGCRKSLLEQPEACLGCGDWPECRGGCRGRAYRRHGSLQQADPCCR